jgi:transposase
VSKQELLREYTNLKAENLLLKEEIALLKKMIFGAKRERFESTQNPMQRSLFELEEVESPVVERVEKIVVKKTSPAPKKEIQRNRFPESLERKTTTILPDDISLEGLTQIGQDVTELLAIRPPELYVKQIIRPRLADKANEDKGVFQAPIPPRLVPKGMVDESLIAEIINEKIQFHTPIHRFAKKLKQAGIDFISENNLQNWFHTGAESLIPLYDLLVKDILAQRYIQGDETRMIVLSKNKPGASHRGQMWAFMAPTIKAVAFNYEPTRSAKAGEVILGSYQGKLQADGYSAYESIERKSEIELINCMAHSRRKFYEAKDIAPEIANPILEKMQALYGIEEYCRLEKYTFHQRLELRHEKAVPILNELEKWLIEKSADQSILPKSLIRKAIDYALSRWKGLSAYAYDGELEIDNNLVENTIRPIALGRKNYLFAGSHEAAQNIAVLYSIVGTCLKNNINVYTYLHWVLKKVASHKITPDAVDWLPHRIDPAILERFAEEQGEQVG